MMNESVWDRTTSPTGADQTLSPAAYNAAIGGVLAWGFGVNFYMVENIPPEAAMQFGFWPFMIGYMACCFGGIMLYSRSDNPAVSFLGRTGSSHEDQQHRQGQTVVEPALDVERLTHPHR